VGNLLDEGFEAVWFKKRSKWIRDKEAAPEKCKDCKHFAVCQGACPLYSIYMDTKSFMIHGNLLVYVRKGVAYEWLESYTGFSVSGKRG